MQKFGASMLLSLVMLDAGNHSNHSNHSTLPPNRSMWGDGRGGSGLLLSPTRRPVGQRAGDARPLLWSNRTAGIDANRTADGNESRWLRRAFGCSAE